MTHIFLTVAAETYWLGTYFKLATFMLSPTLSQVKNSMMHQNK